MPPHPPPKPPHEKDGPDHPPKPPHEKPEHGPKPKPPKHKPPHEKGKEKLWKNLVISLGIGTTLTVILAFVQYSFAIPVNVILPVSAPIWIGTTTLIFTALTKMH